MNFSLSQFFFYMKLGFSGRTLQDKPGVPDILCSQQTKLEVLSQKELTLLQNKHRLYMHLEAINLLNKIKRYPIKSFATHGKT